MHEPTCRIPKLSPLRLAAIVALFALLGASPWNRPRAAWLGAAVAAAEPDSLTTRASGASTGAEPVFDVGLTWDVDSLLVQPEGTVLVRYPRPGGGTDSLRTAQPVAIRLSGAQLLVEPREAKRAVPLAALGPRDTLWIGAPDAESGAGPLLKWDGRRWRGRFKIFLGPRGRMTLATRLRLETYLLGVVPGEIGALRDSLLEAGRAQAIAARSYSLHYRGRRGAEGFDLFSTVEDQVYGPVESERPLATRCVESTRGQVALSQDAPIRANYHSTCGGILGDVWEAWPTPSEPYLLSHADAGRSGRDHCAASPHYRWREEWRAGELAQNLRRFGPTYGVALPAAGVGAIRDVRVRSRSRSGRVWELAVTTTSGEIIVPAHALRLVLRRAGRPEQILRSNLFKIAVRRAASGDTASVVIASGAGSGHGVGLCQTGAIGMARDGSAAEEILTHYYPGIALRRLYGR